MDRPLKSSVATWGGYLYQNLIGLELLCDWLDDPDRYDWVRFEADYDGTPKGLDDVIASQRDGRMVLLQVKFTVDPADSANALTWQWLLQSKPRGRSLLQKWSSACLAAGLANVEVAALVTNRTPDRDFQDCLDASGHVVLDRLPTETRHLLQAQLGSEEIALQFFRVFQFRHSHQGYVALERTLPNRYIPRHTSAHGWNALYKEAIDWAVRTDFPAPDGRIRLDILRGVLDSRRPEPIVQSFRVPVGYSPPDTEFSREFLARVLDPSTTALVLWGSPGQGKSTYLSYLCDQFDANDVPYIRHHYFLDLADASDRFSLVSVANSLMAQMEAHHIEHVHGLGDTPERLREWIEACAEGYAATGKRFTVVIDGLDHVWRENDRNKEPLDSLFRLLLPVPTNCVLVIGTQRVGDDRLPVRLPDLITPDLWIELPRMSLSATKRWLGAQLIAGRFELPDHPDQHDEAMVALAESFHAISAGHPLHLTFSFEALARERRILTPRLVEELPPCPDGDIRTYYTALWQRLSYSARDALHLVADAGFIWPILGLETCLGVPAGTVGREIAHLFDTTDAGQIPFHGSLLAFVKDNPEHSTRVAELTPEVVEWLENAAPEFLKWGWLWILKARLGHTEDLLTLPDRPWAISSLARAYPQQQIEAILSAAERLAFSADDYARAVRFRHLKHRVGAGAEYQVTDYERIERCALQLTSDEYPLRLLASEIRSLSIDELYALASAYLWMGREAGALECQELMRARINDRLSARAFDNPSLDRASRQYLEVTAATGKYHPDRLARSLTGMGDLGPDLFHFLLEKLSFHKDPSRLVAFLGCELSARMRTDLELMLVRLCGICRAHLHDWPEFEQLSIHPIAACWALLYAPKKHRQMAFVPDVSTLDVQFRHELPQGDTERYLHALFFHALAATLELSGAVPVLDTPNFTKRGYLNEASAHMCSLAAAIGAVLARGNRTPFDLAYRLLASTPVPTDPDDFGAYTQFRRALLSVSTDIFSLLALRPGPKEVPSAEWSTVASSPHFALTDWLERYAAAGQSFIPTSEIKALIADEVHTLAKTVNQLNERADRYVELCEVAIQHNLLPIADTLLQKAIESTLGYGWHKDITLSLVMDALSILASANAASTQTLLTRLCPFVASVSEITDGDETSHTKYEMARLLLQLMPRSYVAYHRNLLVSSEWYESDQVFAKLLRRQSLAGPLMPFVCAAVWRSTGSGPLVDRAASGDADAAKLIEASAKRFGWNAEAIVADQSADSDEVDEDASISTNDFPPADLPRLLGEIQARRIIKGRVVLREWFNTWRERGQGMDLLRALEPFRDRDDMASDVSELLDEAFELSHRLEGPSKAYRWLVSAQVHRHGWGVYHSDAEVSARFEHVVRRYPDRWREFIRDTCRSPYQRAGDSLIVPSHRLVQFLVVVGQVDLATSVAEAMVSAVLEDVDGLPLAVPDWFTGD